MMFVMHTDLWNAANVTRDGVIIRDVNGITLFKVRVGRHSWFYYTSKPNCVIPDDKA
jgi:hypothetical protein